MKVGTDAMILGAFVDTDSRKKALDIGAGTGVLSLMLAQQNRVLQVQAIEIEQSAFDEACLNVNESLFSDQIKLIHGDFKEVKFEDRFDLIVSNPPFFENSLLSENWQKNLARHTDGLDQETLFRKVSTLLTYDGCFYMIFPHGNFIRIQELAQKNTLFLNQLIFIESKEGIPSRNIFIFTKKETPLVTKHLVVRDQSGNYTHEYKILTKNFHSKEL